MMLRAFKSYAGIVSLALLVSACGGGGGGGGQQPPPPPQNQTITFATAGPLSGRAGTTVTNVASGGAGSGAISYASSDTAIATVNSTSGVATLLAAGAITITATKAASNGFNSASATYQLTVTVDQQTIAFASAGPLSNRAGTTVTNIASGGAGTGAITYASSDTAIATVNSTSGVATLLAPGTTTITATKAASIGFTAASATYQLNATIDAQTIAFTAAGPLTGAVGTTVTNAASGGAGTGATTYESGNTNVATINASGVATLVGVGTATITATKAASIGFGAATATYQLQGTPGNQTIAFAQQGPINVVLNSTASNVANGGNGTGAISYASNNTSTATVNATTGIVTAAGLGTASITATKAADANYNGAQASYFVNVQSPDSVHAWIGEVGSEVFLPATAIGRNFFRASELDCAPAQDDVRNCRFQDSSPITGASILDSKAKINTAALFAISTGTVEGPSVLANVRRFSERILHGTVFFKNRYWVIGGASPRLPSATPTTIHDPRSDIWSSRDGKTWRLETTTATFGSRWLHKTLVYHDAIWVLGGSAQNTGVGTREVWRSEDGLNYTQIGGPSPLPTIPWTASTAAIVFNDAMWFVVNGTSYSSTDGITWTQRSAVGAIDGGIPREYASFNVYNNKLWYIGGARVQLVNPGPPATFARTAQNDVWSSSDGITWTLVSAPGAAPFAARQQHAGFVVGNKLWVFGGQRVNGGPPGPPPNDAWTTTDGVTWTQAALDTFMVNSWLQGVVQEPNRVTFIGGIIRAYSNKAWTTTDGENWTALRPFEFAPNILSRGVEFNGAMWVIGGNRADKFDTSDIWRSTDGLTWTQVNPVGPIFDPLDSARVVVFNNRMWVLGGWDFFATDGGTETFNNEVWSTADGVNWTKHTPIGTTWSPRAGHEAVVFNGKMWVIGGSDGSTRYNDVWSSVDGVNWILEKDHAAFSPRYTHTVVAFNNAMWLFSGSDTPNGTTVSVGLADVWRSTDGRTWTLQGALPASARMEQATAVFNGRIYLAAGFNNTDYFTNIPFNDVWSTVDGVSWRTEATVAPFSGRNSPILLNHDNTLYLIGGFSISRTEDVWRSSDGVQWDAAFSHPISPP